MTEPSLTPPGGITCEEVTELAGLFVLDALQPDERAAVVAHLETCPEAHEEVRAMGGVAPALASLAQPVDAPPELKSRVMAAYAADAAAGQLAAQGAAPTTVTHPAKMPGRYSTGERMKPVPAATPAVPSRAAWRVPAWAGWTAAIAAVLVLAVVGVWALGLQSQINDANQRAALLSDAIAAYSAPDSQTAVLDDPNSSAAGFAAVTADGTAYVVLSDLPPAPSGSTYQGWYIVDNAPVSAGLVTVGPDGLMLMTDSQPASGTSAIAFTVEPSGGSEQPTSQPFVVGELQSA